MNRNILIVDDSITVRTDLQMALTAAGYEASACATVSAAWEALQRTGFALLILDVMLPDGDGVELLREIRGDPDRETVRVIMLSSESEVRSRVRGLATGADEYVGKPYDPAYVLRCVRRFLGPGANGVPTPDRGLGERKILVIGDRTTYLTVLTERLLLDRHDVTFASSMDEAAELLSVSRVDCIVVDTDSRGVDAGAVCRRIKQSATWRGTPLMVLVDAEQLRAPERSPRYEADAIVPRSTNLTSVRAHLRGLLRSSVRDAGRSAAPAALERGPAAQLRARVVAASGLPGLVAQAAFDRALGRAGIDAGALTPGDLRRALPSLQEEMLAHLSPGEVRWRIDAIVALARLAERRA